MEQFIKFITSFGFRENPSIVLGYRSFTYYIFDKITKKPLAYFHLKVSTDPVEYPIGGRPSTHFKSEYQHWELSFSSYDPDHDIRALPELQCELDTIGQYDQFDYLKKVIKSTEKYMCNLDSMIKKIDQEIEELKSKLHFMPDSDSDEYQDNLEIQYELNGLRNDLIILKSLKPKKVVWVYQHLYEHGDDDDLDNDGIIEEREFKFISYGMKHLASEYNKFLKEHDWIPDSTTETLNEDYIMLTVATAPYAEHCFTLTKTIK